MRAKFPTAVSRNIIEAARSLWKTYGFTPDQLELGRRLFTVRHCGTATVQVKSFNDETDGFTPVGRRRYIDAAVCPVCMYGFLFGNKA